MNRVRALWALLIALAATAGCNAILDNRLYGLADDAGASDHPDATTPDTGEKTEAGSDQASDDGSTGTPPDDGGDAGDDGGCTSLNNIHTCGSCTRDCAQFPHVSEAGLGCTSGQCTYSCKPGYADCSDAGTGCTTPLSLPSSCGGCGVSCGLAAPVCALSEAGVEGCATGCPAGQTNCSNTCSNLATDSDHCGACGTACPSFEICDGGTCQCPTSANPDLCGTTCTSKQTDNSNCGSCGHSCSGGETCQAGVCACPGGQTLCSGTCVNLLGTDVNNCGACGKSCAALPHVSTTGLACSAGQCTYQCSSGYADCGNTGTACNTPLGTASNCSACGAGCSGATPACGPSGSSYACITGCPTGQANCSGTCSTLSSDGNNCGSCGHACPSAETCQSSTCACPSSSSPNFCGSACTNTQTDTANCGACGHACPSVQTCTGGACKCPNSASPTLCGSVCTNTQTDTANCGACGTACTVTGEQCVSGSCGCPSGELVCGSACQTANKCGGCGTLSGTPGAKCGTCGTYVCSADKTSVSCNDPGTTNMCPTWCTSQAVPSGVAASDYQCVDFDNGLPSSSTWPQTVSGSGALSRSTAAADSAPDSLAASISGSDDNAAMTWNDVGSKAVTSYSVSVAINPNNSLVQGSGGNVQLLCVNTGSNSTCVYYTNGGSDANQNPGFTGISAYSDYNGNSVIFGPCELSVTSLKPSQWNTVEIDMTINSGSGAVGGTGQIVINGMVANSSCAGAFMNSTTLNVVVGPEATSASFPWSGYFDNVVVAVKH